MVIIVNYMAKYYKFAGLKSNQLNNKCWWLVFILLSLDRWNAM